MVNHRQILSIKTSIVYVLTIQQILSMQISIVYIHTKEEYLFITSEEFSTRSSTSRKPKTHKALIHYMAKTLDKATLTKTNNSNTTTRHPKWIVHRQLRLQKFVNNRYYFRVCKTYLHQTSCIMYKRKYKVWSIYNKLMRPKILSISLWQFYCINSNRWSS